MFHPSVFICQALKTKYRNLYDRLQKAIRSGRFVHFSVSRKRHLLSRISRYEKQLKNWGIAVATGAAMLMPCAGVLAQPLPVGVEFQVNTETASSQILPSVAMDSDGDFVIVWQSYGQDLPYFGVYGQRYNNLGIAQGNEFWINETTENTQSTASVAMRDDGNFVVVWKSFPNDDFRTHIYGQRFHGSGIKLGSTFQVNSSDTTNQSDPAVAWNGKLFTVVWTDHSLDGDQGGIFRQDFRGNGIALGSEQQVNVYSSGNQRYPSGTRDNEGTFITVWESFNGDNSSYNVFGKTLNQFQANTYTTNAQTAPVVASDDVSDFIYVVWQSEGQDGSGNGIYARRFNYDESLGNEFQVHTNTTGNQNNPCIAMDNNGGFVVAWESQDQDGDGYGIYAQRFFLDGTPDGPEFRVNTTTTGDQQNPSIAMDDDGGFVVVWESTSDDNNVDIHAQRFAPPCADPQTWYYDNDNDGYGAGEAIASCSQLAHTVDNQKDCDDTAVTIFPGAEETCNGLDDDCNGQIDDEVVLCPVPAGLSTSDITPGSAMLHWTEADCAKKYKIRYVQEFFDAFSFSIDPAGSYLLDNLAPATTYQWRIKVKCGKSHWSDWSPVQLFMTPAMQLQQLDEEDITAEVTSNQSDAGKSPIILQPNPTAGDFQVITTGAAFQHLILTDLMGRVIRELKGIDTTEMEFDTEGLAPGLYYLHIHSGSEIYVLPLVIINQ